MGAKANIVVDQGSDFSTTITVRDNSGNAVNLTNYTGHGQIRKHYTSTTAHNMQIVFENPRTNGQLTMKLSRGQTANLASGRNGLGGSGTQAAGLVAGGHPALTTTEEFTGPSTTLASAKTVDFD